MNTLPRPAVTYLVNWSYILYTKPQIQHPQIFKVASISRIKTCLITSKLLITISATLKSAKKPNILDWNNHDGSNFIEKKLYCIQRDSNIVEYLYLTPFLLH